MRLEDVPRRHERLILSDVVLKLTRIFNQAVVRVPAQADVVHVAQAVYFGHLSGRPMTAHKISMFIDMPRTSVLRRLAVLSRNGYVRRQGRYYYVADARLRRSPADLDAAIKSVVAAGKALQQSASEMDICDVDGPSPQTLTGPQF
jgi:hypothetical protein